MIFFRFLNGPLNQASLVIFAALLTLKKDLCSCERHLEGWLVIMESARKTFYLLQLPSLKAQPEERTVSAFPVSVHLCTAESLNTWACFQGSFSPPPVSLEVILWSFRERTDQPLPHPILFFCFRILQDKFSNCQWLSVGVGKNILQTCPCSFAVVALSWSLQSCYQTSFPTILPSDRWISSCGLLPSEIYHKEPRPYVWSRCMGNSVIESVGLQGRKRKRTGARMAVPAI